MVEQDRLVTPFESWGEGLFNLADALDSVDRTEILIARLDATAQTTKITLNDICALALLTTSSARFDQATFIKIEPHPDAVAVAEKLSRSDAFNRHLEEMLDHFDRKRDQREKVVELIFPENDTRRLLKDTIFGFPAAELYDIAQRMADADPFTRISSRLSLWFRSTYDFRRYGLRLAENGLAIERLVTKLIQSQQGEVADRLAGLIAIWTGDAPVIADKENIQQILLHVLAPHGVSIGGLDKIVALEAVAALSGEVDKLGVEAAAMLGEVTAAILRLSDRGSPARTDYRRWITSEMAGQDVDLVFDPFSLMNAINHEDQLQPFEKVVKEIADIVKKKGIATFSMGPFPLSGTYVRRDSDLFDSFASALPEATDLWRLCSCDGDYGDTEEPFASQALWTGDHDPDAITIPEVFDNASRRGDFALCDMLIGVWLLVCCLSDRAPLPDVHGLARRINSLPQEFRSSTYASMAALKREALETPSRSREIQSFLSWLPIVEAAPADDFEAFLRDVLSRHWNNLSGEQRRRLVSSEQNFHSVRRQRTKEDGAPAFRSMIADWASVAEPILRQMVQTLGGTFATPVARAPLGELIEIIEPRKDPGRGLLRNLHHTEQRVVSDALGFLRKLNRLNREGGKHIGDMSLSWADVVAVHIGLYAAFISLLNVVFPLPKK
jgi:hypothetical protein